MGSHSKPRTTGRRTALGALAVGATLTGVGLTAAALDPATAVLSADSGSSAAIQLSGLAAPVADSPQATTLRAFTAAPSAESVSSLTGKTAVTAGTKPAAAGRQARSVRPKPADAPATSSTGAEPAVHSVPVVRTTTSSAKGSGQSAIRPIQQGIGSLTTDYIGKHRQTRTAPPPSDTSDAAFSDLLGSTPLAGLLSAGPLADLLGSVPLLGGL